jgi:hypothetical protein
MDVTLAATVFLTLHVLVGVVGEKLGSIWMLTLGVAIYAANYIVFGLVTGIWPFTFFGVAYAVVWLIRVAQVAILAVMEARREV